MRSVTRLCVVFLLAGTAPLPAQAPALPPVAAGRVKVATGSAAIVRGGQTLVATPGLAIQEADVLRTGADGRLSVMLKDDSRLALGPNSELALTAFAYAPSEQRLALGLRMARGLLSYVSGLIAKLAPESVRLQTPTSIIGVRGTHVLVKADAP